MRSMKFLAPSLLIAACPLSAYANQTLTFDAAYAEASVVWIGGPFEGPATVALTNLNYTFTANLFGAGNSMVTVSETGIPADPLFGFIGTRKFTAPVIYGPNGASAMIDQTFIQDKGTMQEYVNHYIDSLSWTDTGHFRLHEFWFSGNADAVSTMNTTLSNYTRGNYGTTPGPAAALMFLAPLFRRRRR